MKKNTNIAVLLLSIAGLVATTGCENKRNPGKIYMPDMNYSRALETYAPLDSMFFTSDKLNPGDKIYYNRKPVDGTIERNELFPYTLPNDSNGYKMSAQVKNPLPPLVGADSLETARLFNINCAICHGAGAQGNGPISTSGKIGGIANLTLSNYVEMADGTMFHSINYGKNNMGSYAPQLSRKQRWQVVQYIRTLQPKAEGAKPTESAATTTVKPAVSDSAASKK
ncbi:MAG: cytochrome c [Ferruginibacter sp.]